MYQRRDQRKQVIRNFTEWISQFPGIRVLLLTYCLLCRLITKTLQFRKENRKNILIKIHLLTKKEITGKKFSFFFCASNPLSKMYNGKFS